MSLTVIILGKPNVGKSTLYNRLTGKKEAIVAAVAGLTRDYQISEASLYDKYFNIIDTAGIDNFNIEQDNPVFDLTLSVVKQADIIFFLIDASNEITSEDIECANLIRSFGKKVILIANKAELKKSKVYLEPGVEFGFGRPVMISAKNQIGFEDLREELIKFSPKNIEEESAKSHSKKNLADIRIAIAGRPNTGKSTLFNLLNGSKRVLTGDKPGLTRDSIISLIKYNDYNISIIDTAGLRKNSLVRKDEVEGLTSYVSRKEIRYAQLVLLVIDSTELFTNQDLAVARYIVEEGRALVLVLNKWDLIDKKEELNKKVKKDINYILSQVKGISWIEFSSLIGDKKDKLLDTIIENYLLWNKRIATTNLNKWLIDITKTNPPAQSSGKSVKLRYLTQINIRPPTFLIFCNNPLGVKNSYKRFLINQLRSSFGLNGVPIRLMFKKPKNPYSKNE